MADLNELLNKAKEVTKSAANTAKSVASDLYAQGKEKVNEAALKARLKDAYRDLGEIAYDQAKGVEVDGERKNAAIAEIDKSLADLANIAD